MTRVGHVMRIPAEVDQLAAVRHFVRETGLRAGARRPHIDDMIQAVDESATNVIIHGYRGAKGFVEIEIEAQDGAMVVRLRDDAPPFDPTGLPNPDTSAPLHERPFHGMGVFLTRELTDEVTYRQTDDGNELTLVKRYKKPGGEMC